MSMSIGSSADAQSYLQSLLQLGAGSGAASAGAASFADPMLSGGQGSNPIDPSATSGLLGASSSPFQSDTLSSLLSAQGQGAGSATQTGGADGDGDADGSGGAGNSGNTTTQTTTNPDGSTTTTTTTYADGSTQVTTTPAASDMHAGGNTGSNASGNSSNNGLLEQLGKLQSLLAPAVSTLMSVV